ncbi:SdpI family protein [Kosakonia sp. BK9b]|uniref:SdpI family protein n=1 Tax=Kosakonia sp. TaxID=1916651 RepID=UPI002898C55B|nr:SdpI family protein [Kosakonia sp.]
MNENFFYLTFGSVLLVAIAIPLALQKIKPNRWYGVRTAFTLNNPLIWYRANRFYGLFMIVSAVVFFIVSALSGTWRRGDGNANVTLVLFLIEVSVPVAMTFLKLIAMKRR